METKEKKVRNEETKKGEIVPREEVQVEAFKPVGSVEQIIQAWEMFQELKRRLITEDDYYLDERNKLQLKIGGWRKFGIAYGLSTDPPRIDTFPDEKDPREFVVRVMITMYAPRGRTVTGTGYFSTREIKHKFLEDGSIVHPTKLDKSGTPVPVPLQHTAVSRAETRAIKRATQQMIGPVEAEEEEFDEQERDQAPSPAARATQSEGFKGGPQVKMDAGQQAIALNFLKDVLGEDLAGLVKLEEKDGELLVILPAPVAEGNRARFLKSMSNIGQGVSESTWQGLVAHMRAPKSVERSERR